MGIAVTPYQYADQLRKDFADYAVAECSLEIPAETFTQYATQVIACASLTAAVTEAAAQPINEGGQACEFIQIATINIALARECAYEMNDDGTNNVPQIDLISAQADIDADCLWTWAAQLPFYIFKDFTMQFVNTGGLQITTLSLTIGVP